MTEDQAVQILSNEGAQCGNCGDEPGDRNCPDCEQCRRGYVAALMAAGWAPREQPATGPSAPANCTTPCIACMTDESHDPAPTTAPNPTATAVPSVSADTIGLCGYCGDPRESHHHGYVSTAAAIAAAPHRITGADEEVGRLWDRVLELEAEKAQLSDLLTTENKRANDAIAREEATEQAAEEAPADRASVLREAADAVWAMDYDEHANDYGFDSIRDAWDGGTMDATKHLRRMADEAQQQSENECTCDPAPHSNGDGTYSHGAGCPTADAQQRADEAQQADPEPAEDDDMPCGEAGCFCRCTGPVGHACGCDCPHDDDCDCDFCTADEY